MKQVTLPEVEDTDEARDELEEIVGNVGFADWKSSPENVLEEVDRLLKEHGLEVTVFEDGSDTVQFAIKSRDTSDAA
jgi:hypothetical protein